MRMTGVELRIMGLNIFRHDKQRFLVGLLVGHSRPEEASGSGLLAQRTLRALDRFLAATAHDALHKVHVRIHVI